MVVPALIRVTHCKSPIQYVSIRYVTAVNCGEACRFLAYGRCVPGFFFRHRERRKPRVPDRERTARSPTVDQLSARRPKCRRAFVRRARRTQRHIRHAREDGWPIWPPEETAPR